MPFKKRVVLITGASRGIGEATAQFFLKQGATVIGTATQPVGVEKIAQMLNNQEASLRLDVTNPDAIAGLQHTIHEKWGGVDILVNNAGITRDNLLIRLSETDWNEVLFTNLTSIFHLCKAFIRTMIKKQFGRIINVGSVVGTMGNAGQVNYAAAKAGLVGFSKSLAREVASRGVTVNVVAPGFIETSMTQKLEKTQREALLQHIPLKRFGQVNDVAQAIGFLASDAASYITGETLHVNGGMIMT